MTYSHATETCGRQPQKKKNAIRQAIISADGFTLGCMKLRINTKDESAAPQPQDKAIADAYRNKFIIPLDFGMLDSAAPYYQAGLGNRLCYEIMFNDYKPSYQFLSSSPRCHVLYDRILRHRKIIVNKSDTVWNWAFNTPCKSLKGILVLFEEEKTFA